MAAVTQESDMRRHIKATLRTGYFPACLIEEKHLAISGPAEETDLSCAADTGEGVSRTGCFCDML
jgi:hypothetical protein